MPQISGIVSDIYEGKTKAGRTPGSPFWTITLSTGNKLSTFNEEYVRPLVKGHEYLFDYVLEGNYCNLTGVPSPIIQVDKDIRDEGFPLKGRMQDETLPNVTSSEGSERTYKNRISALQAAVNYVTATMGGTSAEKDVVETAQKFEDYINTGEIMEG